MSSHRLSVSGERPYTLTAGGGAASSIQYPAKPGDGASITAQSFDEIEFALLPGQEMVIRTYEVTLRDDHKSQLRVVTIQGEAHTHEGAVEGSRNQAGVVLACRGREGQHPHTNLDVRKEPHDPLSYYTKRELLDEQIIAGRDRDAQ